MGADIEERPDGLAVRHSRLSGADVDGHGDHRIVMALAVAALGASGETRILGSETIDISYPGFVRDLVSLGARMRTEDA
jgi:3-phosphoshikimate 1-carboxyvinyltransferase